MPPLVIEISLALALATSIVKLTTTVNRIEAKQDRSHVELLSKHEIIKIELDMLKNNYTDLKQELKDARRIRFSDTSPH